jgi:hypothetical protein
MAAIQYSDTLLQNQDDEVPDYEPSGEEDEYSHLQNPTKTPIISKDLLRVLPHCPIIHWASQMCNDPTLCVCPCSKLPVHGGKTITSSFIMIMNARWVS